MFDILPSRLRGALGLIGVGLNTLFWCIPLYLVTFVKIILPIPALRRRLTAVLTAIAENWIGVNNALLALFQRVQWDVRGLEGLRRDQWYLVISNHVSGADIPVLQRVFHRRIPFLRFFLKQELIWVPVLGVAWWALDFPFMQRHSAATLAKHPEKRAQDREAVRRSCDRFRTMPTSILNFVEGTRISPEKHGAAGSPYTHLLPPKAGGVAYAIDAMGALFTSLLDVTLLYPDGKASLMDLAYGRVKRIVVHVQQRPIPNDLLEGDYSGDAVFRAQFRAWLEGIWLEKDELLTRLYAEMGTPLLQEQLAA
jgi:1-acyl-sn-glycerol-3-phosphate acyltransferase